MNTFTKEEIELFAAATEYALIVNKKLTGQYTKEYRAKKYYENSLERIGAACLDYAISVKAPPYDQTN